MDAAVALLRVVQFAAATVLCGTPLFLLYGLGEADRARLAWPRRLTSGASLVLLLGAAAALLAQTAAMAGDPAAAFDGEMLATVVTETTSGVAIVARGLAAAAALALCLIRPTGKGLWLGSTVLGAVALASFAWTGHGAATEGAGALPHLVADILHLLAAGVWIGALTALALMLRAGSAASDPAAARALHAALAGFSGIGSGVVAVILVTGLVNSWFLVGPDGVGRMAASAYGLLLLAKLALFVAMLGLAAANRFRHTPALAVGLAGGSPALALALLRRSVFLETAAGFAILALVGVLGVLAPVASQ